MKKRALLALALAVSPFLLLAYFQLLNCAYGLLVPTATMRLHVLVRWMGKLLPLLLQTGVTWPLAAVVVLIAFRIPLASFIVGLRHVELLGNKFSYTDPWTPPEDAAKVEKKK